MDGASGGHVATSRDDEETVWFACAIFFWVYNLMGNALAETPFCEDYNLKLVKFKNILRGLDGHCGPVADVIRSTHPKIQASQSTARATASATKSPPTVPFQLPCLSPQKSKSPIKSAVKGKERERELMMLRAASQKRAVVIPQPLNNLEICLKHRRKGA